MHLAILMTNTDDSAFGRANPDDGQKFTALLRRVRPGWRLEVFSVKDGVFPDSLDFDGLLITGSPASVHDGADWIAQLEALVRDAVAQELPLFGACFGHQIIAKALGAKVGYNPAGWVLGRVVTTLLPEGLPLPIYAAHKEQVRALPPGARLTARTDGCPIAGFAIGRHVLTTQYHPEMSADFIAALTEAFADEVGRDVAERARTTLSPPPDMAALAEWIAAFFEQAKA